MWSDESLFKVISARKCWVRRPANVSRFHPGWCNRTVKHPGQVMIWGLLVVLEAVLGLLYYPETKLWMP